MATKHPDGVAQLLFESHYLAIPTPDFASLDESI
jgi:hypothetical protein